MALQSLVQGTPCLCQRTLVCVLAAFTLPPVALRALQAVRVTKPNIPEAIRRNYELM